MALRIVYSPLVQPLHFGVSIQQDEQKNNESTRSRLDYRLQVSPKPVLGNMALVIQKTFPGGANDSAANPADQLVQRLAEPLWEVEVLLNRQGQPVEIYNHAAIFQRWNSIRQQVLASYISPMYTEKILTTTIEAVRVRACFIICCPNR